MNTNNVYFGILYTVVEGEMVEPLKARLKVKPIKWVLVNQLPNDFRLEFQDLNNKFKYGCEINTRLGRIYLSNSSLIPFNIAYPDAKEHMTKRKIKKLGNEYIRRQIKKDNEEE